VLERCKACRFAGETRIPELFETKENSAESAERMEPLCATLLGDGSLPAQKATLTLLGENACTPFFRNPSSWYLNTYAGGMFHYSNDVPYIYWLQHPDNVLFKENDNNPLLNLFACYIIDRLHTFQNMQEEYAVSPGFDLAEYVTHSTTLHDGTIVYRFSKELLAYLETLVAFSPYYRADDPRVTAHIDKYFHSALEKYQDIP
jgi:hypothetical protein